MCEYIGTLAKHADFPSAAVCPYTELSGTVRKRLEMSERHHSVSRKLELIATWLEMHGRTGKASELFLRVRDEFAGGANPSSVERSLRNWFSGVSEPSHQNASALGAAIAKIAAAAGRTFEAHWLLLPLPDLGAKLGMDRSAAEAFAETDGEPCERPSFTFDFTVSPERMARIREKYCGTYFVYRCTGHGDHTEIVRSVFWMGACERCLIHCSLATRGGSGTGFVIPTNDYLCAHIVTGTGGDQLWSEMVLIHRNHRSERLFVGVWLRPSTMMPNAYRTVLFKKPELDRLAGKTVAMAPYCRVFLPGMPVHDRLLPLLMRNSVTEGDDGSPVLTMHRFEFVRVLEGFDDGEA